MSAMTCTLLITSLGSATGSAPTLIARTTDSPTITRPKAVYFLIEVEHRVAHEDEPAVAGIRRVGPREADGALAEERKGLRLAVDGHARQRVRLADDGQRAHEGQFAAGQRRGVDDPLSGRVGGK